MHLIPKEVYSFLHSIKCLGLLDPPPLGISLHWIFGLPQSDPEFDADSVFLHQQLWHFVISYTKLAKKYAKDALVANVQEVTEGTSG